MSVREKFTETPGVAILSACSVPQTQLNFGRSCLGQFRIHMKNTLPSIQTRRKVPYIELLEERYSLNPSIAAGPLMLIGSQCFLLDNRSQ